MLEGTSGNHLDQCYIGCVWQSVGSRGLGFHTSLRNPFQYFTPTHGNSFCLYQVRITCVVTITFLSCFGQLCEDFGSISLSLLLGIDINISLYLSQLKSEQKLVHLAFPCASCFPVPSAFGGSLLDSVQYDSVFPSPAGDFKSRCNTPHAA